VDSAEEVLQTALDLGPAAAEERLPPALH
jgi:hypothetical protein